MNEVLSAVRIGVTRKSGRVSWLHDSGDVSFMVVNDGVSEFVWLINNGLD